MRRGATSNANRSHLRTSLVSRTDWQSVPLVLRTPVKSAVGFTLLELIGVLVIIALLMAMVAPTLRGFAASRRINESAAQIVALMGHARDMSINEGIVYRFNLDTQAGHYWLTHQDGVTYKELEESFGQIFSLPHDVTARWEHDNDSIAALEHVSFYPTGRVEPANLRLDGVHGKVALVRCMSPTEMFHVETIDLDRPE